MATLQRQESRLIVVRERAAPLPDLKAIGIGRATGDGLYRNLTVVSQYDDESPPAFLQRVLSTVARQPRDEGLLRGAVVALSGEVPSGSSDERRQLVIGMAELLVGGPNGVLVLVAPPSTALAVRAEILALAELAARAVPKLNVKVTFSERRARESRAGHRAARTFLRYAERRGAGRSPEGFREREALRQGRT